MKITIAPSEDQSVEKHPYLAVSIEHPADDNITIEHAVDMAFVAMAAWGFDKDTITKAFHEFIP
jgi:hypothetical protein